MPVNDPDPATTDRRSWRHPSERTKKLIRRGGACLAGALGLFAIAAVVGGIYAGPSVIRTAGEGRNALNAGRAAFLQRDADSARASFTRARTAFASAASRLDSPILWPSRVTPVVRTHISASRSMARIGRGIATLGLAGSDALEKVPGGELRVIDGKVDLATVRLASQAMTQSLGGLASIEREISAMPRGPLIPPLDDARTEALNLVPGAIDALRKGEAALKALPSILAEGGQKRYLLAFSSLAELRGSGGFIGYSTILGAKDGKLGLEAFSGRPREVFPPPAETGLSFPIWFPDDFREEAEIIPNINLTSDFPTSSNLLIQAAAPVVGAVDGVIGIDPIGISAFLSVTGPITLPSWPEPITAENVSRIAHHDVYERIADVNERDLFFGELVRSTFERFVGGQIAVAPQALGRLDAAVRRGSLRMYSPREADQANFVALGLGGGIDRTTGATDVLSVISENASGNKIDWFLRRRISYRVRLDTNESVARTELRVEYRNDAPSSGLSDYVIGSSLPDVPRGTNRQIVMLVRARLDDLEDLTIDGEFDEARPAREASARSYVTMMDVPARSTGRLHAVSTVLAAFFGTGRERRYRLDVLPQAIANADHLTVTIEPPRGWHIVGRTEFRGQLLKDQAFEVQLNQTLRAWIFERMVLDPWHMGRRLLGRVF